MRTLATAILCGMFFVPQSFAQQAANSEAPLGLTWGASAADIRARGVELKDYSGSDFGKSYFATGIERALSDQNAALLSFGHSDKLWRIVINGKPFTDDPFGSAVLSRYGELQTVLTEKYGKAQQSHRLGESIYNQPRYFISGLNGGQSSWFSNFDTSAIFLQLAISALDGSTANYRLIYEYKPLRKEFDASKRSKEKGSL